MFNHVLIIGLGLMGSSLARSIKRQRLAEVITGNDLSERNMKRALEIGIIDKETKNLTEAASESDLIIICTPLSSYQNIARAIARHPKSSCLITDVGSVKGPALENFYNLLTIDQKRNFVPGHPITGSEKSGVDAAPGDIYKKKNVILSPFANTGSKPVADLKRFWEMIGANVVIMDSQKHDEIFASVSHIPQLLCYSFADTMAKAKADIKSPDENFLKFTRLGGSDAAIWLDIFLLNQKNICKNLTPAFYLSMADFIKNMESGNREAINGWFSSANAARKEIKDDFQYRESALEISDQCDVQVILPRMIASVYLNNIPTEFFQYAGPGFMDFTRIALTANIPANVDYAITRKAALLFLLNTFFECFDRYYRIIECNTKPDIFHKIKESRENNHSALHGKIPH